MSYVLRLTLVSFVSCFATSVLAETAFIKVPPPVYAGLVRDYMRNPYEAKHGISVFARRVSDAKLLASASVFDPTDGLNYSLTLPMLSASSTEVVGLLYDKSAAIGARTATISCLEGDVLWADLATVTPEKPGFQRLDVTLGHDANGDGIADEYAAYMAYMMEQYGLTGAYDPEADYNGDGVSNRAHYLAGSNPFAGLIVGGEKLEDSVCTISTLMNVRTYTGDEYFAITFNALEEFSYSVMFLDDLSKSWGEAVEVASRETKDYGELEVEHCPEATGEMTLYVKKGATDKGFYKLVVRE